MQKSYHVVPDKKGGYDVKKGGHSKSLFNSELKSKAEAEGRKICRKEGAELYVHGRNGRIQYRDSYGKKPLPPEG